MPAKISTLAYVHESTERLTQDFTVKEIMAVSRLSNDDPTKVVYLKVKAFIPSNRNIEEFETGDVIFLRGKFIACAGWYLVRVIFTTVFFLCLVFSSLFVFKLIRFFLFLSRLTRPQLK